MQRHGHDSTFGRGTALAFTPEQEGGRLAVDRTRHAMLHQNVQYARSGGAAHLVSPPVTQAGPNLHNPFRGQLQLSPNGELGDWGRNHLFPFENQSGGFQGLG